MFRFQLCFQFGNALAQRRDDGFHFGGRVTWRDVLGTVPIEVQDIDEEQALHDATGLRRSELSNQFRMLTGVLDSGVAKDLQARPLRIVHKEQMGHKL